jgi:hypothetical protein
MTTYTEIQDRIAHAASKQDFDEAARLSQIASQLKRLEEQKNQLLASVQPITSQEPPATAESPSNRTHVQNPTSNARTGSRGGLSVELTTKGGAPIRICERTSSETLVVLMERILAHFGMPGLEKLMGLQISRGPLVSRDPRKDYLNSRKGDLYTHHRIPGTSLYVLTHSDNEQKVKDIRSALRLLGLPDSAFNVSLA